MKETENQPGGDRGRTPFEVAYELGKQAAVLAEKTGWLEPPGREAGKPFTVIPVGYQLADLSPFLGRSLRRGGTATFRTADSFLEYVRRYRAQDGTLLLVGDESRHAVTAYLDYHQPGADGKAGPCEHRAELQLALSPEWKAWTGIDGKGITQLAFAEFLEDHLREIVEPEGAAVLEAATKLEASKSVAFVSGVNLTNGCVQFRYEEEEKQHQGKGLLTVPARFELALPPYEGEGARPLAARLRHRIAEQKLTFIVKLDRPDLVLREAYRTVTEHLAAELEQEVLLGSVALR